MEQCPQGDMRDDIKRMGQEVSLGEASGRYWCPTLTAVKRSTCPGGRRAKGVYFMLKTKKDKEH